MFNNNQLGNYIGGNNGVIESNVNTGGFNSQGNSPLYGMSNNFNQPGLFVSYGGGSSGNVGYQSQRQ